MSALRHRILEYIEKTQLAGIIPESITITDQSFKMLIRDKMIAKLIQEGNHPIVAISQAVGLPFEIGDRDQIVGKSFVPSQCPNCGRLILNPRIRMNDIAQLIKRLDRFGKHNMICICGHSFLLSVERNAVDIDTSGISDLTKCPRCGGEISFLSSTEAFCLNCNWDNLHPLAGRPRADSR